MNNPKALILLPRLQVQNANTISGPLTWGFPSPTAFAGFVHALERCLADELDEGFGGVGIVCHQFDPQVTKPGGKYTQVFNLTRNPTGKKGETLAIVEEGRVHMEVSLVIALYDHLDEDDRNDLIDTLMQLIYTLRLAGGSILPQRNGRRYAPHYFSLPRDSESQHKIFRQLCRRLLPGFALVQREDRLQERLNEMQAEEKTAQANALDALLDLSRLNMEPESEPDNPDEVQWRARTEPGWLVPIPIGYAAISPLYEAGKVLNARDETTPLHFVENLYSLGEWVSPHRLTTLQQLLWHNETDVERGIYRCVNHYPQYLTNTANNNT